MIDWKDDLHENLSSENENPDKALDFNKQQKGKGAKIFS